MNLYSKDQLIEKIREISARGWHRSVKQTVGNRNDGAVGNTLEALLGLTENNLPIANTGEWELKGQRSHTTSLVTLKHIEPSPKEIVPHILVAKYGWKHPEAGKKYPCTERSFRLTVSAQNYTRRGFKLDLDKAARRLRLIFSADKVDCNDERLKSWLESVREKVGLGPLSLEPYWELSRLEKEIVSKIKNCFYVIADTMVQESHEFFKYRKLFVLSRFSFDAFVRCIEEGVVVVDFDARTGHNHGTKFRIRQNHWHRLYQSVQEIDLA